MTDVSALASCIAKDDPGVSDVHVDAAMGKKKRVKQAKDAAMKMTVSTDPVIEKAACSSCGGYVAGGKCVKCKTVQKRDFTAKQREAAAKSGAAMKDGSFPIKTKMDLENAIKAVGRASDPASAKAHIIDRAKALDAVDMLPATWNVSKSTLIKRAVMFAKRAMA